MSDQRSRRSFFLVCLAAAAVITLLIFLFVRSQNSTDLTDITLPELLPQPEQTEEVSQQHLSSVSRENVQAVLGSMSRAKRYAQTFVTQLNVGDQTVETTCRLWVCGAVVRAEVESAYETKHILSDGKTLYLWYDQEKNVEHITLDDSVTLDDLAGIPTYEDILRVDADAIREGEFLSPIHDSWPNCIYAAVERNGRQEQYWVSLDTGLLVQMQTEDGCSIRQTEFRLLSAGDEALAEKMKLPNGRTPFELN